MKIKFEFATIGDVFEQSFKLVVLAVAVATVNALIGDELGIVVILSLGIFMVSQFIRLVGLVSRLQTATQEIQSVLPSLEVGREDIESVEKLVDYIDDSLDEIEGAHLEKLEAVKAGFFRENQQEIDKLKERMRIMSDYEQEARGEIEALQADLAEAKRALTQAWNDKSRAIEEGRGEVQRLKERIQNLESVNVQSETKIQNLQSAMKAYKDLDVFFSGDNEAIKAKYLSIVNRNNAKKKELEMVS